MNVAARRRPPLPAGTVRQAAIDAVRHAGIDALRGIAIGLMIAFHVSFDLTLFGLSGADFYRDAFWLTARSFILGSFLILVGVSLHLASLRVDFARGFWRRLAAIAGCALLVSAGSWLVFPGSYIYFGVLHAIALSLLLARPLAQRPWLAAAIGVAIVAAGNLVTHPLFDARPLQWIGFTTVKPRTEDYVPLFPWLGVVLCGIAVAAAARRRPETLAVLDRSAPRWLAAIGRHSLAIYMVHQPLLIGALWLYARA